MRKLPFALISSVLILLLGQCNSFDIEDLYYEPLIEGIYNIDVDNSQQITFTIEPFKAQVVEGVFDNEIPFKLDFSIGSLQDNEKLDCRVLPVMQISGLPDDLDFQFGFYFTPGGTSFNKHAVMTMEFPQDFNVADFKCFIFEGDDPAENGTPQIWEIRMTPVTYERKNGKLYGKVDIPHFSGLAGFNAGNFKCSDPRSADFCIELQEIIACHISGKESLEPDDIKWINDALRAWMEDGLSTLEDNPSLIDEEYEFLNASKEMIFWKSIVLKFNDDLLEFNDLLDWASEILTNSIIKSITEANNQCSQNSDNNGKRASYELNFSLLILLNELQSSGLISENIDLNPFNFCDGIGVSYLDKLFIDTTNLYVSYEGNNTYTIKFPPKLSPALARSVQLNVFATNLIGEALEISAGEDYEFVDWHPEIENGYIINGATITEKIIECYNDNTNSYYPCYHYNYGMKMYVRLLKGSEDAIILTITRSL